MPDPVESLRSEVNRLNQAMTAMALLIQNNIGDMLKDINRQLNSINIRIEILERASPSSSGGRRRSTRRNRSRKQ